MSDRGYVALSLEIKAKAIEVDVAGMLADNQQRRVLGEAVAWDGSAFRDAARELEEIAEQVRALAP